MLLYIIRHAESAPTSGMPSDAPDSWHVTEAGRRAAAHVASVAVQELGFHPDLVLSSPSAAAQETVPPVREALGGNTNVAIEAAIDADASLSDFYRAFEARKQFRSAAIITHVPLIARLLPDLLGAESPIELPQGGIACVQCRGGAPLRRRRARLAPPAAALVRRGEVGH